MIAAIRNRITKCAGWMIFLGAVAAWLALLAAVLTTEGWLK